MKKPFVFIIGLLLCMDGLAGASEMAPYREISAPEVNEMLREGRALVIHVLSEIEYDIQHIPGSINIPITKVRDSDKLPVERTTPLVFYCMGVR